MRIWVLLKCYPVSRTFTCDLIKPFPPKCETDFESNSETPSLEKKRKKRECTHQDKSTGVDMSAAGPKTGCLILTITLWHLCSVVTVSLLHLRGWEFCNPVETDRERRARDSRVYIQIPLVMAVIHSAGLFKLHSQMSDRLSVQVGVTQ